LASAVRCAGAPRFALAAMIAATCGQLLRRFDAVASIKPHRWAAAVVRIRPKLRWREGPAPRAQLADREFVGHNPLSVNVAFVASRRPTPGRSCLVIGSPREVAANLIISNRDKGVDHRATPLERGR
jgi:hypothetical protein